VGHYETLGVTPDAAMSEIRRRYLAVARESHPDFHTGSEAARRRAEVRMRDVNAAWAVLGDVDERAAYDRQRLRSTGPVTSRPTPPFHATARAHEAFRPFDTGPDAEFDDRHDLPISSSRLPAWLAMLPALLLVLGVGGVMFGSIVNATAVVDLGLVLMLVAGVLFLVAAPLVALGRAARGDRP